MGTIQFLGDGVAGYTILFAPGLRIAMSDACCCVNVGDPDRPDCNDCFSDSDEYDVTLDGTVGSTVHCTTEECDLLNGTFRLTRVNNRACTWGYFFPERYTTPPPEPPWCEGGTEDYLRNFWPYFLQLTWWVDESGDVPKYHPIVELRLQDSDIRYNWPQYTSVFRWDLPAGLDNCSNVSGIELENRTAAAYTEEMCIFVDTTAILNAVAL